MHCIDLETQMWALCIATGCSGGTIQLVSNEAVEQALRMQAGWSTVLK